LEFLKKKLHEKERNDNKRGKVGGFNDVVSDMPEKYHILGEEWICKKLMIESI